MWNTFNYKTREFIQAPTLEDIDCRNAVAYLRISTSKQEKEWKWIDSQRWACLEAEKHNKHSILKLFEDKAISGKVLDRKWLMDCLVFIKERNKKPWTNNIKYLYCTEISRISRPEYIDEWLSIIKQFREQGVIVYDVFCKDYYERWDDLKIIQLVLKLYSAKQERENWAHRSRNWVNDRLKAWYRAFSSTPIWYKYEHRIIDGKDNAFAVKDEPNASILANALKLYWDWTLYNAKEFLQYLRDHKLTTNSNCTPWTKIYSSLFKNIMDPKRLYFYAWMIVVPDRWIIEPIVAKHEAIIDQQTLHNIFLRLEKAREKRPYKTKSNSKEYFKLRTVIKCKACKSNLRWYFAKKKYPKYECKNEKCPLRELDKSQRGTINADEVHEETQQLLTQFTLWEKAKDLISYMTNQVIQRQKDMISQQIHSKKNHIKTLERTKNSIEDNILTVAEWMRKSFEKKREECDQEIKNTEKEIVGLESEKESVELQTEVLKVFENPVSIWDNYNTDIKQLLLKVMFNGNLEKQKNQKLRTPDVSLPMRLFADLDVNNTISCPQQESNLHYSLRRTVSYPLNDGNKVVTHL